MKKIIIIILLFIAGFRSDGQILSTPLVIQEQSNWCWAAVSKCVLNYAGISGDTVQQCRIADFVRRTNGAAWGTVHCCINGADMCNQFNNIYGDPASIQGILMHFGGLPSTGVASSITEAQVKNRIACNKPFVIRWAWPGGHFLVVHGIVDGIMYVMNPWPGEGETIGTYGWVVSGSGHTWTHTLTLDPIVVPDTITGGDTICTGQTTALANTTAGGTWSSGATGIATVGSSTGVVTGVAAGTVRITYKVSGCTVNKLFTVSPTPAAITGTTTVCRGYTTPLSNATAGGVWTSSNTAVATISATGVVTGVATGTSVITYAMPTGCQRTTTVTVTAGPAPISGALWACVGGVDLVSCATPGGVWSSSNPAVGTISALGTVTGIAAGTTTLSYNTGAACVSVATFTVKAAPGAFTGPPTVCVGNTITLTNASGPGVWTSSTPAVATVGVSSGIVTGVTVGTTTISYANGCGGAPATKVISVTASPAALSGPSKVCATKTITLVSTPGGGTWLSSATGFATVTSGGVVTGVAAGVATISYTAAGCTVTKTITVGALPSVAPITGAGTVCIGKSRNLACTTAGGVWSSSDPAIAFVGSSTGTVAGVAAGTVAISYTVSNSAGCSRTLTVSITVVAPPVVAAVTGPSIVCNAPTAIGTTTFACTTAGGTWSSANTSIATVNATTGVVTAVTMTYGFTDIIYTVTNTAGCKTQAVRRVTIVPATAPITGPSSVCVGATITLADTSRDGIWTSDNTARATVGILSGVVTGVVAGTVTISYLTPFCEGVAKVITVNPNPPAITGTPTMCVGRTRTLANATAGGTWTSSNTAIATVVSTTGVVTGVAAGSAIITYTLATGCYTTIVVSVTAVPPANTGTATVCAGRTTTLENEHLYGTWSSSNTAIATVDGTTGVVTGVAEGMASITYSTNPGCDAITVVTVYPVPAAITGTRSVCLGYTTTLASATPGGTWSSSDDGVASVDASGVVTGVALGTTNIIYTNEQGCYVYVEVTVNPLPAEITGELTVCVGHYTILFSETAGGTWSSSDEAVGTVDASGNVHGLSPGTTNITYTSEHGCYVWAEVTVYPIPAEITGTLTVCIGQTTTLTSETPGGTWSSYDEAIATVDASGVVTGVAAGTTDITYRSEYGCYVTATVTVYPLPTEITGELTVCVGNTTTLTSETGGTWSSSDEAVATVDASGVVTGVAEGTANITYTNEHGCYVWATVTVYPHPAEITGELTVCVGHYTILFSETAGGTWSSSDEAVGTVDASGNVHGLSPGTTNITYTSEHGCYVWAEVTVYPIPAEITGTLTVCIGQTTTLASETPGGTWSSYDEAIATVDASGVVTGVAAGTTDITYRSEYGCYVTATVTVYPLPTEITGELTVCVGNTTTLTSETGGTWSSSDEAVATVDASGVVTGVAEGTANITYTNEHGCYVWATVTVYPIPAEITGELTVCAEDVIALASATPGGTWSSSDEQIATVDALGNVTGVTEGTANITYTSEHGCYVWVTVTVYPYPADITGELNICVGNTTTLASETPGGTWSSGDESIATVDASGVVTGVAEGTANITYTNEHGCYVWTTVTVYPHPADITGTLYVCVGSTTTLENTTPGGTWSSSDESVATVDASGVVTGVAPGTANITYTTESGCYTYTTVTVYPVPAEITGTLDICVGTVVTLASETPGGTWSSSDESVATIDESGNLTAIAGGTADITYTTEGGCYAVATVTVQAPPADISGTLYVCMGNVTLLSSATTGGTWSSSDDVVATVDEWGNVTGVTEGTANITYTNEHGCYVWASVTVYPIPAEITGTLYICAGSVTTLASATPGGMWSSDNEAVATVDAYGNVTGINEGTANITYTTEWGCYTAITVTVYPVPDITGTPYVCVGSVTTLTSMIPGGVWTIDNYWVATVDAYGNVTGVSEGTANITYTTGWGCYSVITITVYPVPDITGAPYVCVGSVTTLSSMVPGGYWTSDNNWVATVDAYGNVTGVSEGTANITYTTEWGCYNVITITVYPVPDITGIPYVCVGSVTTLSNMVPGGYWSSDNNWVATVDAYGNVTGVSEGTANITYTTEWGCYNVITITVYPVPDITGTPYVCVGSVTTLSNMVPGGYWSSDNNWVATVDAYGNVIGVSEGTANITYTTEWGCYNVITVTVYPVPDITGTPYVCVGSVTTLSSMVPGGYWSSDNNWVATVDAYGNVTGVSEGTANITYTIEWGCYSVITITVYPVPDIIGTPYVCVGSVTTLSSMVPGGVWTIDNYWVATVDAYGNVTGISEGTANITYTTGWGCYSVITITVYPVPDITGTPYVCVGSVTTLSSMVPGGVWTSDNYWVATVDAYGNVTGVSEGTANITYTTEWGCYSVITITVYPIPAEITGTPYVCVGGVTTLASATPGGVWSSDNNWVATVDAYGNVTGVSEGTANITYTTGWGCYKVITVTVYPVPDITGTPYVCVGSVTTLSSMVPSGYWTSDNNWVATVDAYGNVTGVSEGTANITYTTEWGCYNVITITVYPVPDITGIPYVCVGSVTTLSSMVPGGYWSSDNYWVATVDAYGNVTGVSEGTANITYTTGWGCYNVITITVYPVPDITGTPYVCVGSVTTLTSMVPGGYWTSDNNWVATVDAYGNVTGISEGTANITYTTGWGCYSVITVTVYPVPDITGTPYVCVGSVTTLSGMVPGGVWTIDNYWVATVDAYGNVTGVSEGTANITYTTEWGCYSVITITVYPVPDITGTPYVCVGSVTTLSSMVPGGVWTSDNYWIATVDAYGNVTGVSEGTANITYTTEWGCYSVITITVYPVPDITGTPYVCVGSVTTLSSMVPGGVWTSDNNWVATVDAYGNVTGVSEGTANITYTTEWGCYNVITITVYPVPDITGTPYVCVGSVTTLSSMVPGGYWTSDNYWIATVDAYGNVTGVSEGTANITYTTGWGCYKVITVTVYPVPDITGTPYVCVGSVTILSSMVPGGYWTSDNNWVATVDAYGNVTGVSEGTANITYTTEWGCYSVITVTVYPVPDITGTPYVCVGSVTTLASAIPGGVWSSDNEAVATVDAYGNVTGIWEGTANITYTTEWGCYAVITVTVYPVPEISGTPYVCVGSVTTLSSTIPGGIWSSDNDAVATVDAYGNVTGVVEGTANIYYSTEYGCTAVAAITVLAVPMAIIGPDTVCIGAKVTMTDTVKGGTWSSSDTTVATIDSLTGEVTGVAAGSAIITYSLGACFMTDTITVKVCLGKDSIKIALKPVQWSTSLLVAPNPNTGSFIVSGTLALTEGEALISITDMLGKVVHSGSATIADGRINILLNLSSKLANGEYILTIHTAMDHETRHLNVLQQ